MAFILRNTKLVYNLVGFACQTGRLASRNKKILFLERPNIFNFKDCRIRSKVSLAQKESEQEVITSSFDRNFYQLNQDVRRKNVSMKILQSVLSGVQKKGDITNFELMTLLKSCTQVAFMASEKERIEMAEKIWKTAESLGVEFNVTHYNALLDVFLDNNHVFLPSEFLNGLEKAKLTPNIHTYRRLLKAYCQQGDLKGASNILNKMKEMDCKLNEIDFNALILGYCNTGELDKAEEILRVMESKHVEPSAQTYVNLLCGYAKHGLIEKLDDTLKALPSKEVFLSDKDLLEVFYALAVNNHGDKIDVVLQAFSKGSEIEELISKFIHRLFHKNLDSVALNLLDHIENSKLFTFPVSVSQNILEHFISYRTPEETLKTCNWLEKKDMTGVPLAYTLKTVFQITDEEFSLKFFDVMKENNLEVRKHYYWPGIIKASKKGNSYFLAYLKKIPKNVLHNLRTVVDFVFPNYSFGENWQTDINLLNEAGVPTEFVTRYLAEKFLLENRFDDFVQIVSSQPVFPYRTNHIFNLLSSFLKTYPEKTEQVVDAVYKLTHDFYNLRKNSSDAVNLSDFFDGALKCLLKHELEEKTVIELLENMLEKKLIISNSMSTHVKNLYKSQRVEELVRELTETDLKFEIDESLLSLKDFNESVFLKRNFKSTGTFLSVLSELFDLITKEKFDEALKICEQLYSEGKELINKDNFEWKFRKCYLESAKKGNLKLTEKLFEVGVSLRLLKPDDFVPVVRSILLSKNVPEAIDRYCEFVLHHGNLSGCIELLSELVSQENVEGCQKIVDLVTDIRNKNTGLSVLVCAFIRTKNFEKARKVLETPGFTFSNKVAYSFCVFESKKENSAFFEKLLEIVEALNYFRGSWLYRILAEKYVEEKKTDKLMELWPKIPREMIGSDNFFKQYASFVENPSDEQLKVFSFVVTNSGFMDKGDSVTGKTDLNGILDEEKWKTEKASRVEILAREGKISELVEVVKKSPDKIKLISDVFFQDQKIENYFKLVQSLLSENELKTVLLIFYPRKLLPYLKEEDHFMKYKSLAIEGLKKNVVEPFIFCLIASLLHLNKIQDAKRMLEENSSLYNLNTVKFGTLNKVLKEAKVSRSDLAKLILSDEELKEKFSVHLPRFYASVFYEASLNDDTKSLVDYLNMAKSDGSLDLINNQALQHLVKEKLKNHNISFPLESWN